MTRRGPFALLAVAILAAIIGLTFDAAHFMRGLERTSVDKRFDLQGRSIRVENGVCVDAEGTLAGCDLDMISAVRNAMTMLGLSLEDAVAVASRTPAPFLGLADRRGAIAPGMAADLVLLNDALEVEDTWIDGIGSRQVDARRVGGSFG